MSENVATTAGSGIGAGHETIRAVHGTIEAGHRKIITGHETWNIFIMFYVLKIFLKLLKLYR